MRALAALLLAVTAVGCGSRSREPAAVVGTDFQTTRISSDIGTFNLEMFKERTVYAQAVPAPPEHVWQLLTGVYAELEIPVTTADQAAGIIGNRMHRVRRQLGGESMSRYVDCGSSMTGPNADSYTIDLSAMSAVRADSVGDALLVTAVGGRAKPTGLSTDPVECNTTGRLERRIANMVLLRLR